MYYYILLITSCAFVHLSPVYRAPNIPRIHTEILDANTTTTAKLNAIDRQFSEMNNTVEENLKSLPTQTHPKDITTKQSSVKHTPGFPNISTEGRETHNLQGHSPNSTADPWGRSTEIFEDDENASLQSSEGGYEANAPCVSQQTKEEIETPCSVPVTRPPKCNINNIIHIRQAAFSLIQIMRETHATEQNNDGILSDIHLYRLNKTIRQDDQLGELEKSLQIYFMYLSEASSVYSTMSLSTEDFTHLRVSLLTALCNVDNGISSDHMIYNVCLSRDLSIFYTQIIYILESLRSDIEIARTWKHCQANV